MNGHYGTAGGRALGMRDRSAVPGSRSYPKARPCSLSSAVSLLFFSTKR